MDACSSGLCSYSMYIYAFMCFEDSLSPLMFLKVICSEIHKELWHFEPFKHKVMGQILVNRSKHMTKHLHFKFEPRRVVYWQVAPVSVSWWLFVCKKINGGIYFILFTCKSCPVSESVAICLHKINIFVTSSPAKQSSFHRREKPLCNSAWSMPNSDELLETKFMSWCVCMCI